MVNAPRIDIPQPGFYKLRLVKGGPFVPARIWTERERHGPRDDLGKYGAREVIRCQVGDELVDVMQAWPGLRPITKAEFDYLVATRVWAQEFAPHMPEANERKKIDLNLIPPIY